MKRLTYFATLAVLSACGSTASGQELRASLSGVVADPGGAAIAGAQISVRSTATGIVSTTISNSLGQYLLPPLPPGPYTITAQKADFRTFVRENLVLAMTQKPVLDIRLEIDGPAENITVRADAPLLDMQSSRGTPIFRPQVVDLPNNGRNIYQLVWSAPGVTKTSTYWGSIENYATGNATNVQINGGVARENETLLDGVSNTQPTRDVAFQPPLEAVEEVAVRTANYDASYGRFGGGAVAITTKSGTNGFHGTLHETNKVSALSATAWVYNSLGEPKDHFVNNTFGFQSSGPFYLPGLFDGRDRAFFMVAYEGLRERSKGVKSTIVPTAAERTGDFSGNSRLIYDPLTTRQQGSGFARTPFEGNRIPAYRLDPVAQRVLAFVPLPNLADRAFPLDNYANFASERNSYDQWLTKFDYQINPSHRVSLSYGRLPYEQFSSPLFGANSPAEPSASNPQYRRFYRWVGDWTGALSPSTIVTARAGLARYVNTRGSPAAAGFDPRGLGMDDALVSQFRFLQFPSFVLGGGYSATGPPVAFQREARDTWSYQLNLSRSQGRHVIRAGSEFRIYNDNTRTPGRAAGQYNFSKGFTQANPAMADSLSGNELASFLLGNPSSGVADLNIDPAFQSRYFVLFLHDDFRVTTRLTLNLGIRWDYEQPYAERYNRMQRGFAFGAPSPIAAGAPSLSLTGGLLFAGPDGDARLSYRPDRNNVQPRIGAAYRIGTNWVLRGGYGMFYLGTSGRQSTAGFSQTTSIAASLDGGNTPRVSLANPFPEGLVQPTGNRLGLATNLGLGLTIGYLDRALPYSRQFSFGLQTLLPGGVLAEADYSGNLTRRYPLSASINVMPVEELGKASAYYADRLPNPLAGLLPLSAARNGATIARQILLLPFPQYGGITMTDIPIGRSSYHGLQMRLTKRYSAGYTLQVAYAFSKTLERMTFLNPQDFDLDDIDSSRLEKRLAQFDVPHKLSILGTMELPFGAGHAWASNARGLIGTLISGWQINGQLTLQSGFPVDFPNAAPLEARSARLADSERTLYRAFDTSLFPRTAPNLDLAYRTFPTRFPDVRLYPLRNVDISLSKKTRIRERFGLEFRVEFLNAANHPWFSRLHASGNNVTSPQFGWYEQEEQNQNRLIALVGKFTW